MTAPLRFADLPADKAPAGPISTGVAMLAATGGSMMPVDGASTPAASGPSSRL